MVCWGLVSERHTSAVFIYLVWQFGSVLADGMVTVQYMIDIFSDSPMRNPREEEPQSNIQSYNLTDPGNVLDSEWYETAF